MTLINLLHYLMVRGRVRWLRRGVAGWRAACGGCGRVRAYEASTPVPAYRPAYVTPGAAGAPATARGSPEQVGLSSRQHALPQLRHTESNYAVWFYATRQTLREVMAIPWSSPAYARSPARGALPTTPLNNQNSKQVGYFYLILFLLFH